MFNIIKAKDCEPYASGLRWYKIHVDVDKLASPATFTFSSDDFNEVYDSFGTLPLQLVGPCLFPGQYGGLYISNFVITDVKIVPAADADFGDSALMAPNVEFSGYNPDCQYSKIDTNPSLDYFPSKTDIYVQGCVTAPDAVLNTGDL